VQAAPPTAHHVRARGERVAHARTAEVEGLQLRQVLGLLGQSLEPHISRNTEL